MARNFYDRTTTGSLSLKNKLIIGLEAVAEQRSEEEGKKVSTSAVLNELLETHPKFAPIVQDLLEKLKAAG